MFADINLIKSHHIVGVQGIQKTRCIISKFSYHLKYLIRIDSTFSDSADHPGKFIINELITSNQADSSIHIFCYEQYCEDLKSELAALTLSNVHFHDCLPNDEFVGEKSRFRNSCRFI